MQSIKSFTSFPENTSVVGPSIPAKGVTNQNMNRQLVDFGIKQQSKTNSKANRMTGVPSNTNLNDMGVFPFEDDRSEYSCMTGALSNYTNNHSVFTA
jgi:hypothetical protein